MNRIQFPDDIELFDIRLDHVFKAVFTRDTPPSQGALSRLISAIIGRNLSVTAIDANEPPVDSLREKRIRFDINCKADTGELVNIEMSLNPNQFELIRLEYYTGKLSTGQEIQGVRKTYGNLTASYQIAILAKRRFFEDTEFYHNFEYYDVERRVSLGGLTRIITMELSKVEQAAEKPVTDMSVRERWAVFFEYLTNREKRGKINEILAREEGIAMAGEVLMRISRNEIERAHQMSRLKYELDLQSNMVQAWQEGELKGRQEGKLEGRQEGKLEGRLEGKLEIARNLKKEGDPPEKISRLTGLSITDIADL
jgi:predicted transposase/invertase (TIGR01784 family)